MTLSIIRSGKFSMNQFSGAKDQQHYHRVFIFVFSSLLFVWVYLKHILKFLQ